MCKYLLLLASAISTIVCWTFPGVDLGIQHNQLEQQDLLSATKYNYLKNIPKYSKFVRAYQHFHEEDNPQGAEIKFYPKLIKKIQKVLKDGNASISQSQAVRLILTLEELLTFYKNKNHKRLQTYIRKEAPTLNPWHLLEIASFLLLPKNFLIQLTHPITTAWGTQFINLIKNKTLQAHIENITKFFPLEDKEAYRITHPTKVRLKLTLQHPKWVTSAKFNHDSSKVLTTSLTNTCHIWDSQSGECLQSFTHDNLINCAFFNHDSSKVVTASRDATAKIWDTQTGDLLHILDHSKEILFAMFNNNSSKVVTASRDATAKIWDAQTGKCLHTLSHDAWVHTAQFNYDGSKVITASEDLTAKLWDTKTGNLLHTLEHDSEVLSAYFNQESSMIITSTYDNFVYVWDVNTGKLINKLKHSRSLKTTPFSYDNSKLLTNTFNKARIWSIKHKRYLNKSLNHKNSVIWATFSPDDSKILTTSTDNTAKLWNSKTGNCIGTLNHIQWVVSGEFNKSSSQIITASFDRTAKVWELFKETKVTAAEYLFYQTYLKSKNKKIFPPEAKSFEEAIVKKLNARVPEDQPLISIKNKQPQTISSL